MWILELLTLQFKKYFLLVTVACIVLLRLPLLATNILPMYVTEMNISPFLYVAHT